MGHNNKKESGFHDSLAVNSVPPGCIHCFQKKSMVTKVCSTSFHEVPWCSTGFHSVPLGSTRFGSIPQCPTGFPHSQVYRASRSKSKWSVDSGPRLGSSLVPAGSLCFQYVPRICKTFQRLPQNSRGFHHSQVVPHNDAKRTPI